MKIQISALAFIVALGLVPVPTLAQSTYDTPESITAATLSMCSRLPTINSDELRDLMDAVQIFNKKSRQDKETVGLKWIDVKFAMSDSLSGIPNKQLIVKVMYHDYSEISVKCGKGIPVNW